MGAAPGPMLADKVPRRSTPLFFGGSLADVVALALSTAACRLPAHAVRCPHCSCCRASACLLCLATAAGRRAGLAARVPQAGAHLKVACPCQIPLLICMRCPAVVPACGLAERSPPPAPTTG